MRSFRSFLFLFLLLSAERSAAQKQYWGLVHSQGGASPADSFQFGGLYRVDSNALHPEVVLSFDTTAYLGILVTGAGIMQASDGKIYGIAVVPSEAFNATDHLFSYDPVTDSLSILVALGSPEYPHAGQSAYTNLTEASPGVLFGTTTGNGLYPGTVFKYFISNDSIALCATVPSIVIQGLTYHHAITGPLLMSTNGRLYGTRSGDGSTYGKMARIDPLTNGYAEYDYDIANGYPLNSDLRERNGKLYGTCVRGGPHDGGFFGAVGTGTIFEFDPVTNVLSKKLDFNDSVHNPWRGFLAAQDGRWYGEAVGSLWNGSGVAGSTGCLYAYDPSANALHKLVDYAAPPLGAAVTGETILGGLLAASNGRLYGSFQRGLFEYDPVQDTLRLRANMEFNGTPHGSWSPMIEICRKPNYRLRSTTHFNVCAGSHFFHDLQNVNATSVVWRRNGNIVPAQTSSVLEFVAITEGDEGVWTCTMANACGVTEPPAITITVNAGTFTAPFIGGDTLLCGTGDQATLTGNAGGTWSTGATSAAITVDVPGTYYTWNTQACGISLSNAVTVMHLDSARAPYELLPFTGPDDVLFCPQQSIVFPLNDPGPWGVLPTGIWQDGSTGPSYTATDTGLVYVTSTNACNADTSRIYHVVANTAPPLPELLITNAYGWPVDTYLCGEDSLYVTVNAPDYFYLYSQGMFLAFLGGGMSAEPYVIDTSGVFDLVTLACGVVMDTLTFTVYDDDLPPAAAVDPAGHGPADRLRPGHRPPDLRCGQRLLVMGGRRWPAAAGHCRGHPGGLDDLLLHLGALQRVR
ncbi:MAG: hypothetical protein QM724_12085 [Flavobacteriales bacterium]